VRISVRLRQKLGGWSRRQPNTQGFDPSEISATPEQGDWLTNLPSCELFAHAWKGLHGAEHGSFDDKSPNRSHWMALLWHSRC